MVQCPPPPLLGIGAEAQGPREAHPNAQCPWPTAGLSPEEGRGRGGGENEASKAWLLWSREQSFLGSLNKYLMSTCYVLGTKVGADFKVSLTFKKRGNTLRFFFHLEQFKVC